MLFISKIRDMRVQMFPQREKESLSSSFHELLNIGVKTLKRIISGECVRWRLAEASTRACKHTYTLMHTRQISHHLTKEPLHLKHLVAMETELGINILL